MPWVDMHDMLNHAYRNHYAVGGFRVTNSDFIVAILAAAERCRSPVILNLSDAVSGGDIGLVAAAAERAAQRATVPVALHFERAGSPETATRAINLGCNGLTVAVVHESFPVNVAHARQLVDIAHACGVTVEGGLAAELEGTEGIMACSEPADTLLEVARAYVQHTRVDCLAISIDLGNGSMCGRPKLDVEHLRRFSEAVQIPLAVHAGSPLSDEHCHKLIQHGVSKVNFSALLEAAACDCVRAKVRGDARSGYTGLMEGLHAALADEVERCIHRCGSAGRAAEVQAQCRVWQPVQHVIVYNVEGASDAQVEAMMVRGREVLGRIPGVRRVFTGWAVQESAKFRYCWLVEFVHEKVIDSYRDHPDHVAFANQLFRPIAGDRISIDFASERCLPAASLCARTEGRLAG